MWVLERATRMLLGRWLCLGATLLQLVVLLLSTGPADVSRVYNI
jgi:hypothetical protein